MMASHLGACSKRGNSPVWFRLVVRTVGLFGGVNYEQPYDYTSACRTCGAGSEPVGPLVAQLSRMGRKLLDQTAHDGHLVATRGLADALVAASLTGLEVRPVRRAHAAVPDSGYCWLRVAFQWPPMAPTSGVVTEDLCPECRRTGYFDPSAVPGEWHYSRPPDHAADFGHTRERFGIWRAKAWPAGRRGVGGAGGLIVSARARTLLESLRVRHLEYVPVLFDEARR